MNCLVGARNSDPVEEQVLLPPVPSHQSRDKYLQRDKEPIHHTVQRNLVLHSVQSAWWGVTEMGLGDYMPIRLEKRTIRLGRESTVFTLLLTFGQEFDWVLKKENPKRHWLWVGGKYLLKVFSAIPLDGLVSASQWTLGDETLRK